MKHDLIEAIETFRILAGVSSSKVPVELLVSHQDRVNFRLERSLFFSALACRKMIEASKFAENPEPSEDGLPTRQLPPDVISRRWQFTRRNGKSFECDSREFCNQIIHSYEISWDQQPIHGDFAGFWLASDKELRNGVYFVFWRDFIEMIDLFFLPAANANN